MKNFYTRSWLNEKGTGFITASITPTVGKWCCVEVEVADCYRKATLSFDFGSNQEKKKKLKKLDLMINTLQALRSEIVALETGK